MASTDINYVWVRLYYEGKGEPVGQPFEVEGIQRNINALANSIKEKCSNALSHCDANQLTVYEPATIVPVPVGTKVFNPWDPVPTDATGENPLIVVAPQQQQQPSKRARTLVFQVSVVVKGALRSNGARGNVYKLLERHKGFYARNEGIQIAYQSDDLHATAYFKTEDNALNFQNALNEWEIHKELANLDGVELIRKPDEVDAPADLEHFMLQDYKPIDSESPCHSLNYLHSYQLSVPITQEAEPTEQVTKYQSLDISSGRINPYKCHLKSKSKFKSLQNEENNMVVASWHFHQMLDGLNTHESLPLVALSVRSTSEHRLADHDNRYCVTLSLEFFEEIDATCFQPRQNARRINKTTWETVVYVSDKNLFQECVEWKGHDTRERWRLHREFLDQE